MKYVILIALSGVSIGYAQNSPLPVDSKLRIGVGAKLFKTATAQINFLGIEYSNYHSEIFFMGGAVYTGQIAAGASGAASMGGLVFGVHAFRFSPASIVISLTMGASGGFTTTNEGGFLLLPDMDVHFAIGPTVKAAIGVGYGWVPGQTLISGLDIGAKIIFVIY